MGEGRDGDESNTMRYGGGRWHPRTNKYLFRILHSTPLQRVWFPGSIALLMHPSTQYSHPQSTEIIRRQRENKFRVKLKANLCCIERLMMLHSTQVCGRCKWGETRSVQFFTYTVLGWECDYVNSIWFYFSITGKGERPQATFTQFSGQAHWNKPKTL